MRRPPRAGPRLNTQLRIVTSQDRAPTSPYGSRACGWACSAKRLAVTPSGVPLAQVARVARFLRIDASADLLARVVEKSSFHFMAAAENQARIDGDQTSTSILASIAAYSN